MSHLGQNFPQIVQALRQLDAGVATISQILQSAGGAQPEILTVRVIDAVKDAKQALDAIDQNRTSLENYDDFGEGNKSSVVGEAAGPLSRSLYSFAKTVSNAYSTASLPEVIATKVKPFLESFEKVQSSYQTLATDNNVNLNTYQVGLTQQLPGVVDDAFEKLGGR